jgi:hypothetical protein
MRKELAACDAIDPVIRYLVDAIKTQVRGSGGG